LFTEEGGVMIQTPFSMPDADQARAAFGERFNPEHTLNGAIVLAAAGELALPAVALMKAVYSCPVVSERLREAMVLRTAVLLNCSYTIHVSTQTALQNGLTRKEVAALLGESPVRGIEPDVVLIALIADDIADHATLQEHALELAIDHWGADNVRQLVLMLGWFNLMNRYENACRVPIDAEEKLEAGLVFMCPPTC
jgi:alkylhydroperoxidase family enzyme